MSSLRDVAFRALGRLMGITVAAVPSLLSAQIIRGTARDRLTQSPIAGALIGVRAATGDTVLVRSTLSAADGSFALRLPVAGRFVVVAKGVGFQRASSEPLDVQIGETKIVSLTLDPIDVAVMLRTVVVTTLSPCKVADPDRARLAFYWEEAQTALSSSDIATRDSLFRARITRSIRDLHPKTGALVSETSQAQTGYFRRAFASLPAAQLSTGGFVQRDGDSVAYHAPDANVLLSSEFLRDHCFSLVRGVDANAHQVGLRFVPIPKRNLPEIRGTIWVDSATFRLDRVDFQYVGIHPVALRANAGGSVRFAVTSRGLWHVAEWALRIPVLEDASPATGYAVTAAGPTVVLIREIGGVVYPEPVLSRPVP